jgi:hypothetical protein
MESSIQRWRKLTVRVTKFSAPISLSFTPSPKYN